MNHLNYICRRCIRIQNYKYFSKWVKRVFIIQHYYPLQPRDQNAPYFSGEDTEDEEYNLGIPEQVNNIKCPKCESILKNRATYRLHVLKQHPDDKDTLLSMS